MILTIYILTVLISIFLYRRVGNIEREKGEESARGENSEILFILFVMLIPVINLTVFIGFYIHEKDFKLKWLRKLLNED